MSPSWRRQPVGVARRDSLCFHGSMETLRSESFAKAEIRVPAFRMSGVVGLPRPCSGGVHLW